MGVLSCGCLGDEKIEGNKQNSNKKEYYPKSEIYREREDSSKDPKLLQSVPDSSTYFETDHVQEKTEQSLALNSEELVNKSNELSLIYNYKKIKLLGKGSYGEVWLVKNKILDKECAMKIIPADIEKDEEIKILNEIDILKILDHPNIIKIYDFCISEEKIYFISEYCPEGDLFEEIFKRGKALSEIECASIMDQTLKAMKYLHKMKIIHRDIKPENIMINKRESNGYLQVKLIDFGLAIINTGKKETYSTGTTYFIAPEVLNKEYDERCDIWSLGVSMYELLTLRPPFDPRKRESVLYKEVKAGQYDKSNYEYRRLSKGAKDLIDKFLTVDPDKRITIDEALNHTWFKNEEFENNNQINKISPDMAKYLINNISSYRKDNILKCAVLAYLVHNNTNLELCVEAKKLFNSVDYNSDGKIIFEELKTGLIEFWGLTKEEAEDQAKVIFNNLDTDHNNYIEYEEFVRAAVDPTIFINERYLKFAFNFFDKDNSDDISIDEIKCKFVQNYTLNDKEVDEQLKNLLKKYGVDENKPLTLRVFYEIMPNILKD